MLRPIDIVTRNNQPTGEVSNPEDATNRGLWHRGAHAFIITKSRRVLIQKRPDDALQYPSRLDLGVGGFVDTHETPEQAIIREIAEETGIIVTKEQLTPLGISRYNHRWHTKDRQKISRAILYNFAVILPSDDIVTTPQRDEVSWIGFITYKSALWLAYHGSLKHLGKLAPLTAYYRRYLRQAIRAM